MTSIATIAKETAVIAQKASIKESISGFKRDRSDLKETEDSDDGENRLDVNLWLSIIVIINRPLIFFHIRNNR